MGIDASNEGAGYQKMSDENKTFVQECYTEQYETNKVKAETEGWWTGVRKDTNKKEMEKAMKRTQNNKASGPSQVIEWIQCCQCAMPEDACDLLH